jgi:hypothetical protein
MKADEDGDLRVIGNGSINGSPAWAYTLLLANTPGHGSSSVHTTVVRHLASSSATTGLIDAVLGCDGAWRRACASLRRGLCVCDRPESMR